MMASDYCKNDPDFQALSKADKQQIEQDVNDILGKATSKADAEMALSEYEKKLAMAKRVQKANAYRNRAVQARLFESVTSKFKDNPFEGLMAPLVGSQKMKEGARFSTDVQIEVKRNRYEGMFGNLLNVKALMKIARSGQLDLEVRRYLFAKDTGGDVSIYSDVVKQYGDAIDTVNTKMRAEANRNGALVGDLDGYAARQNHDMFKIRSKKSEWLQFMRDNLDLNKSLFATNPDKFEADLLEQWSEFASGAHVRNPLPGASEGQALGGYASVAKSMSRVRKIVFKNADAEHEYALKFGGGTLLNDVYSGIQANSRKLAILETLGPNPQMNIVNAADQAIKYFNKLGDNVKAEAVKKAKNRIMRSTYKHLTGEANIPVEGGETLAAIESTIATVQRASLLSNTVIATLVGDPVTHAINMAMLDPGVMGFLKGYTEMFAGMFKKINDPETVELMNDIGVTTNLFFSDISQRFDDVVPAASKAELAADKIQDVMFKVTLQHAVDQRLRSASAHAMISRMGTYASKQFSALPERYQTLLKIHDISDVEWDILRSSTRDFRGYNIIDVVGEYDDALIDSLLQSKGLPLKDFHRDRLIETIRNKYRNLIQDQQSYSIIKADARMKDAIYGDTQRGTASSLVKRQVMLLKSWPLAYAQRVGGRWYNVNDTVQKKVVAAAGIMTAMTMAGFVLVQIDQLRKGREPLEINQQTMAAAFLRGGGLGIYGDLLFSVTGESNLEKGLFNLLGPTAQDINNLYKIATGVGDRGERTLKFVTDNIPGLNFAPIKAAVDYMLLNAVTEAVSPGALQRMENKLNQKYGNDYFMLRPSETSLF